ncbi:CidA/LrgA family holin-like protein [Pelosinus sp. IPA-1]|uniref:CidA/LrgA family holin-like protein n=1 Tax=Pelosinus sp. IPA-1 TaxID=3029569 RepID=UPI0024361BDA|nr:CidA/LrgA family holin-like protein [Pelosinus sp. IPA-1]GMA97583.1 membrane protein [Pelosinus sp. IPA-1]
MQNALKTLGQIFLLWLIYSVSTWIIGILHLPLPGSVLGMLLLFTLLSTGIIKEQWLSLGANPLLKHLSFFFIPIAVGLMDWGGLFTQKGHLLFLPLVISAFVALLATGGIAQFLTKYLERKGGAN